MSSCSRLPAARELLEREGGVAPRGMGRADLEAAGDNTAIWAAVQERNEVTWAAAPVDSLIHVEDVIKRCRTRGLVVHRASAPPRPAARPPCSD